MDHLNSFLRQRAILINDFDALKTISEHTGEPIKGLLMEASVVRVVQKASEILAEKAKSAVSKFVDVGTAEILVKFAAQAGLLEILSDEAVWKKVAEEHNIDVGVAKASVERAVALMRQKIGEEIGMMAETKFYNLFKQMDAEE